MSNLVITDRPMSCCGLVMGSGFDKNIQVEPPKFNETHKLISPGTYRKSNRPDFELMLKELEDFKSKRWSNRNCSMLSLSSEQTVAIETAKEQGYKVIFEFYNPNSGNQVYILTKVTYQNEEEYKIAMENRDEDDE